MAVEKRDFTPTSDCSCKRPELRLGVAGSPALRRQPGVESARSYLEQQMKIYSPLVVGFLSLVLLSVGCKKDSRTDETSTAKPTPATASGSSSTAAKPESDPPPSVAKNTPKGGRPGG